MLCHQPVSYQVVLHMLLQLKDTKAVEIDSTANVFLKGVNGVAMYMQPIFEAFLLKP